MSSGERRPRPAEFRQAAEPDRSDPQPSTSASGGPPVWLLDIDGVLNAFAAAEPGHYRTAVANGYLITWDAELTDRIHRLHLTGRVEVRWLTTWAQHANTSITPLLGWSELVVSGEPRPGLEWWKLRYAVEVVEGEGRRLVWTDDDLPTSRHALEWLSQQAPADVLTIAPDPTTGLTSAHIDRIEAWVAAY